MPEDRNLVRRERPGGRRGESDDAPLVELRHVTKRFGQGAVGALDVSLSFAAGRMVALFGPSGSGKTTVLHMIGLLMPPDEGEIWLEGRRVDGLSERASSSVRRQSLGFVFQSFGLVPLLTAEENVMVALRLLEQRRGEGARAGPGRAGDGGPGPSRRPPALRDVRRRAAAGGPGPGAGALPPGAAGRRAHRRVGHRHRGLRARPAAAHRRGRGRRWCSPPTTRQPSR